MNRDVRGPTSQTFSCVRESTSRAEEIEPGIKRRVLYNVLPNRAINLGARRAFLPTAPYDSYNQFSLDGLHLFWPAQLLYSVKQVAIRGSVYNEPTDRPGILSKMHRWEKDKEEKGPGEKAYLIGI